MCICPPCACSPSPKAFIISGLLYCRIVGAIITINTFSTIHELVRSDHSLKWTKFVSIVAHFAVGYATVSCAQSVLLGIWSAKCAMQKCWLTDRDSHQ